MIDDLVFFFLSACMMKDKTLILIENSNQNYPLVKENATCASLKLHYASKVTKFRSDRHCTVRESI